MRSQRALGTTASGVYRPISSNKPDSYLIAELTEEIKWQRQEIIAFRGAVMELNAQVKGMALQKARELNKPYYTIEDVTELFGFSGRLQQEERTEGRLRYLKKEDGKKILYSLEHLTAYIEKHFVESNDLQTESNETTTEM